MLATEFQPSCPRLFRPIKVKPPNTQVTINLTIYDTRRSHPCAQACTKAEPQVARHPHIATQRYSWHKQLGHYWNMAQPNTAEHYVCARLALQKIISK